LENLGHLYSYLEAPSNVFDRLEGYEHPTTLPFQRNEAEFGVEISRRLIFRVNDYDENGNIA